METESIRFPLASRCGGGCGAPLGAARGLAHYRAGAVRLIKQKRKNRLCGGLGLFCIIGVIEKNIFFV